MVYQTDNETTYTTEENYSLGNLLAPLYVKIKIELYHTYSSIVLIASAKNDEKVFTKDSSSFNSSLLIANKIA